MVLNYYPPRGGVPILPAALASLLCSSVSFGRTGQSIIRDLVTDTAGATMPGLTVTVNYRQSHSSYKITRGHSNLASTTVQAQICSHSRAEVPYVAYEMFFVD